MTQKTMQDPARPRLSTVVFSYWRQVRDWKVFAMLAVMLANIFGGASLHI